MVARYSFYGFFADQYRRRRLANVAELHTQPPTAATRILSRQDYGIRTVEKADAMSTPDVKIAILVLGCRHTHYQRCIQTIRATWARAPYADIFYVYGAHGAGPGLVEVDALISTEKPELAEGEFCVSGDIILCGAADVFSDQANCVLQKRLIAFRHLMRDYDFVYTVCASSYVDVAGLEKYAKTLPRTGVYQGAVMVDGASGFPFVSGSGFLISRDIVADLANSREDILSTYPKTMPDDVAVGHFIANKYGGEAIDVIAGRIHRAERPTQNQTFIQPYGGSSMDFVLKPEFRQVPEGDNFHFHFHSQRMWDMENFHRRFFSGGEA